jgi:hypothetical protein
MSTNKELPSLPRPTRSTKVPLVLALEPPQAWPPLANQHSEAANQHATTTEWGTQGVLDREMHELREEIGRLGQLIVDKDEIIAALQQFASQQQQAVEESDRREALLLRSFRVALEVHQSSRPKTTKCPPVLSSVPVQDPRGVFEDSDSDYI